MFSKQDYELINLGVCIKNQADRLGIEHDGAERARSVVAEEPECPTSMKPFHREYPGLPRLFHTYCSKHPEFGTCEEEVQAYRDIADHLAEEHYAAEQEGAATDA